jgi:hypothetical protein
MSAAPPQSVITEPDRSTSERERASVRAAFWAAFLVRVAYITLAHTYRMRPYQDHFEYGWEMGRIGRALATGYGYADPFSGHTGPTAWVGPLYPLLIALVFKLTGVYTLLSAWILLTLNSLFSALTVFPIAAIARRCFAPTALRTGYSSSIIRWSVWLWALYPAAMQYAVRWIWETSLSTLLITCAFALALRMRSSPQNRRSTTNFVLFAVVWGAIALANPALVLFLPFAGLWVVGRDLRAFLGAAAGGLVFLAILSPWMVRNYIVFHQFVPLRANFGAELYLGNGPGATGLLMEYQHPHQDPLQLQQYAALGEYRYAKIRGQAAVATIRANPGLFARNSLKRMYFFWFGVPNGAPLWNSLPRALNFGLLTVVSLLGLVVAVWRRVAGAWLFALAFLTVPLMYYFVTVHARFRHPLEPLIAVLGVYLFQSAEQDRRQRPAAG